MTDLYTAMEEAVASVGTAGAAVRGPGASRRGHASRPPSAIMRASFFDVLRHQFPAGTAVAAAVRAGLEMVRLAVLFLVATMLVAFGEDQGQVTVPLVGQTSSLVASLLAMLAMRAVFAVAAVFSKDPHR